MARSRRRRWHAWAIAAAASVVGSLAAFGSSGIAATASAESSTSTVVHSTQLGVKWLKPSLRQTPIDGPAPITKVVVIVKENHTYDNVLGPYCATTTRPSPCESLAIGTPVKLKDGTTQTIQAATDNVPNVDHEIGAQKMAKNDDWDHINGCTPAANFGCLSAVDPSLIPNIANLASAYTISDDTNTCGFEPSWMDHVKWMTACYADGFVGHNPVTAKGYKSQPGHWNCDAKTVTAWRPPGKPGVKITQQPSCIPGYNTTQPYGGAFRKSPVPYTKTLVEECQAKAGCSWTTFATQDNAASPYNHTYLWNINSAFGQVKYSKTNPNPTAPVEQFMTEAQAGTLPTVSYLMPSVTSGDDSQHNGTSMTFGDDILGQELTALMSGPDWSHTAVFLTWDDCGCFYDQKSPTHVPMIIISPYAKPGYTDHNPATFAGVQKYVEWVAHLASLNPATDGDSSTYAYADSFDYTQAPLPGIQMVNTPVPTSSRNLVGFKMPTADDDS